MVKHKKMLPTLESHMPQLLFKWRMHQLQSLFQIQVSQISVDQTTTQKLQVWIQTKLSGKELLFMTEKSMEKKITKKMLTTSKLMVRNKKLLLIPDFHMLQLSFKQKNWVHHQSQVLHSFQKQVSHTLRVLHITQEHPLWIQMPLFGKELLFMTVRSMGRKIIKRMLTTFKLMVKSKRLLQTPDSHMLQHSSKLTNLVDHQSQVLHSFQKQVSHTLRVLPITLVQVQWTQMVQFGKELLSMMVRYTERKIIKRMLTTFKHMVKHKKMLPTLESHMPQHSSKLTNLVDHQSQVLHSFQKQVSHTLVELPITLVLVPWIQTKLSGKELLFMMAKSMERKIIKRMLTTSKNMVKSKRLLQIQDFHMHQPLFKHNHLMLVRHINLLDKCHWVSNSLKLVMSSTLMMTLKRMNLQRPLKLPPTSHMISDLCISKMMKVSWWDR